MHGSLKDGVVYKTKNLSASDDRDVFFFRSTPSDQKYPQQISDDMTLTVPVYIYTHLQIRMLPPPKIYISCDLIFAVHP